MKSMISVISLASRLDLELLEIDPSQMNVIRTLEDFNSVLPLINYLRNNISDTFYKIFLEKP